jgi:hypothetical protein
MAAARGGHYSNMTDDTVNADWPTDGNNLDEFLAEWRDRATSRPATHPA